jgi:hypothetical protein
VGWRSRSRLLLQPKVATARMRRQGLLPASIAEGGWARAGAAPASRGRSLTALWKAVASGGTRGHTYDSTRRDN